MSKQTEDIETIPPETEEVTTDTTSTTTKGKSRYIMKLSFKICNALFICGTFIYFMITEVYPLRVLEALTYQVKNETSCGVSDVFCSISGPPASICILCVCTC